jgi:hypothetical protein
VLDGLRLGLFTMVCVLGLFLTDLIGGLFGNISDGFVRWLC